MKRILVTGANKGIGLATVENLLQNHPDTFLILGSRDEKRGDEALGLLTSKEPKWYDRLMMLAIDVSNDESVTMAATTVASSFEADAKPSISPSEMRSRKVANCLLCKVSGVLVGCGGGGGDPPPPDPRIILFVMPVPVEYQQHHL